MDAPHKATAVRFKFRPAVLGDERFPKPLVVIAVLDTAIHVASALLHFPWIRGFGSEAHEGPRMTSEGY